MSGPRAKIVGVEKLQRNLRKFGLNMDDEIKDSVKITAEEVKTAAIKSISRNSRGAKSGDRWTSAPGKPPNSDSGDLIRSMRTDLKGLSGFVGSDLLYSIFLEYGTVNMKARPFLRKSLRGRRSAWNKRLKEISKKAASKVGK